MKKPLRSFLPVLVALLLFLAGGHLIQAQQAPAPSQGTPDPNATQGKPSKKIKLDPAARLDRRVELLKTTLGATDEEWVALKPLLVEVVRAHTAQSDVRASLKSGSKKKQQAPAAPATGPDAAVRPDAAGVTLSTALAENAPPSEIKLKMDAYRAAIKKADEALKAAREKLRLALTAKQEATLLLLDYMD